MKKFFRMTTKLVATVVLGLMGHASIASHQQGADLIYQNIAPNTYLVQLKFYRDCSGIAEAATYTLNIASPGCNTGRSIVLAKAGPGRIGTPYCASIPVTCGSTGRPNYQEFIYQNTFTLTTAELACSDWRLSVNFTDGNRPTTANVQGAPVMYVEAFLKIKSGTTNIVNNSPEFDPTSNLAIPFVSVGQEYSYSLAAIEQDGDSLAYSLVAPLSAANTPVTYGPLNATLTGTFVVNPNKNGPFDPISNPQIGIVSGITGNFSPTFPIVSYRIDWNQRDANGQLKQVVTGGSRYFHLDSITGLLRFKPVVYDPTGTPGQGKNKYNVAVKVEEWRKINGTMVLVGFVRRDMLFIVEQATNAQPVVTTPPAPPQFDALFPSDSIFVVQSCNATPIRFHFTDPDSGSVLDVKFTNINPSVTDPVAGIPGASLSVRNNNTDHVSAVLYITPEPQHIGNTYRVRATISDNGCPFKSIQNKVYTIRVVARNQARIAGAGEQTICIGNNATVNITHNRPDSVGTLNQAANYAYTWSLVNGNASTSGLNPSNINSKVFNVTPTAPGNYRYLATINNTVIGGGACVDTVSVLIKVVPLPEISNIRVEYAQGTNEVRFGSAVRLVPVMSIDTAGLTYSWSNGETLFANADNFEKGVAFDTTSFSPLAGPLKNTEYTLKVTSANGNCVFTKKVMVMVGAPFLPNVITPNGDGYNDTFEFKALLPNTKVQIFNRWGVLVKEYSDYKNEFDGKGVSEGTYYYFIKEAGGTTYKGFFDIVH